MPLRHWLQTSLQDQINNRIQLTTKQSKQASIESLVLQMGTSIKMIERHYARDRIHDYKEEFAG